MNRERQRKILEVLRINPEVRVSELRQSLGVSEATVRRDLERLEEMGKLQRIHGGALRAERMAPEPPVVMRASQNEEEKQRIGRAAAKLIEDGETVFIGSGTTALEVAKNLDALKGITVITNALPVLNTLAAHKDLTLISIGGILRADEMSFIGHIAELGLRELRPHKVFMGIRAISLGDGLTNDSLPEVSTDRGLIHSSAQVIILADHSKFGKIATAFVASTLDIQKIITDSGTPTHMVDELREAGVEVVVV